MTALFTSMPTLYGIPNCDTVRKARRWLDQAGVRFEFVDLRTQTPDATTLQQWCAQVGWKSLLNTRSRTWRELPPEIDRNVDESSAIALMMEHPTLIKRPVLVNQGKILVGFKEADYQDCVGL